MRCNDFLALLLTPRGVPGILLAAAVTVVAACARTPAEPEPVIELVTDDSAALDTAALPSVELTPELLYDLLVSEFAAQHGELDTALESLARVAVQTRDPRAVGKATGFAFRAGEYEQALELARLWHEVDPDSNAAAEALVQILVGMGREAEAEQHLVSMIEQAAPEVGATYRWIGEILSRQQAPGTLAAMMDRLVALHPQAPEAHFARAMLAARQNQHDTVDLALTDALRLRPDWEDAAILRMVNLMNAERGDDVPAFADRYLAAHPKATRFRSQYARWLVEQDRIQPALGQYRAVLRTDPENADALYASGLLSMQEREYEEAREFLERHLFEQPENDQTRIYLGQIASELGQYEEAENWYNQVSDQRLVFDARLRRAAARGASGDVDGAIAELDSLQWSDRSEQIRLILARDEVLREAKRLTDAKRMLDSALAEIPDDPDLLYARGLVSAQLKLVDEHERDLRRLIEQEPDNAHAYNALGYTLTDLTDRHDEAFVLITKALELSPEDPFIMDSMGWVQYRLGNTDAALEYLQRAFDLREDAEIAAHLGEVLWVTGSRREARRIWRRGLELGPENPVLQETIRKLEQ